MKNRPVSRRTKRFILALTIILGLPLISLFSWAQESKELVICTYGGTAQECEKKAFFEPFEKLTGIKIIATSPPYPAKIKSQVMTKNVEWDLFAGGPGVHGTLSREGCLEKIDYSQLSKEILEDIPKSVQLPDAIGFYYFSDVIAYRTDVFPKGKGPKNCKDFWDVKTFPGPRSLHSAGVTGTQLEFAIMADGVPKEKVYPIDLERAFKSFDRIKPHVAKWWKDGAEPAQMLTDKEAVMVTSFNGRIEILQKQGVPVEIEWNEGQLWPLYLNIVKGARNYKNALRFLNFALQPKPQADFANLIAYGPVSAKSFQFISAERAKTLPTSPENRAKQLEIDRLWYAENMTRVMEYWNNWILQK